MLILLKIENILSHLILSTADILPMTRLGFREVR